MVCICRKLTKHMYFVACLVLGSHLHLSSFNINTNINMKRECKTVPSLCKGEGAYICFCKKNVLNKKLLFFWFLLQYTWYGILNLIKIIHAPRTIHYHDDDTPLRTAFRPISALRTAHRHVLASRTAYRLITKQPFLAISFT